MDSNSNEGISLFSNSDVVFGHNRIVGNALWGIRLWDGSDPVMRGSAGYNNIDNNDNAEIYCQNNCVPLLGDDGAGLPGHNDVNYDNTGYAIYIDTSYPYSAIKAERNWWGSTDSLTIRSFMFPADFVDFSPWDSGPNTAKPVLSIVRDPALQYLQDGFEAEASGDYLLAIEFYRKVLGCPESKLVRAALGGLHRSYFALGDGFEEFRGMMEGVSACTENPGIRAKADALARWALVAEGKYEQAIEEYRAVVKAGGREALSAEVHMGEIYLYCLKDVERARAILREVIAEAPGSAEAFAARMALEDAGAIDVPRVWMKSHPEGIELASYPNPFNPRTVISFELPEEVFVRLVVYNLLGQKVRVLVEEVLGAGVHTVTWDGRDDDGRYVSSGVYVVRLEAGGKAFTRKMLLVR